MAACLLSIGWVNGQLVNQGATIVVKPGATLTVESDISNTTGGTMDIQGELVVQGDLTNDAGCTFTTSSTSLVKFTGDSNSNITMNGESIKNLTVEKDDVSDLVVLNGNLDIDENLIMTTGLVSLGNSNLNLTAATTTATGGANGYALTDMGGQVIKTVGAGEESFTFPVGNGGYSPLLMDVTGSTLGSAPTVGVRVENVAHPMNPSDADDFLSRHWVTEATDITDYTNAVEGTYLAADLDGAMDAASLVGASYSAAGWSYVDGASTASTVSGTLTEADSDFTGTNFYGKVDLKVFLQGALSGTTMTTALNSAGLIPTTSPYSEDPVVATTIPNDVTDWVLIEVRDPADPSVVLSSHSAFLMNNGEVRSYMSASDRPLLKDAATSGIIAIKHRNHLPVRMPNASPYSLTDAPSYDFSTGFDKVYQDAAITNTPMKNQGGVFCLWSGNANGNTKLQYNGGGLNDRLAILLKVGFGTPTTPFGPTYSPEDVNMDGMVQYNGGGLNDRLALLLNVGFTTPTIPLNAHL